MAPRAARGPVRAQLRHDEHRRGRRCCANAKVEELRPRGAAERPPSRRGAKAPSPPRSARCRARPRVTVAAKCCLGGPACVAPRVPRSRARWLTRTPCSPATCDVAGRVLLAAKEDPARERHRQSAQARSRGHMAVSTTQPRHARLRAAGATAGPEGALTSQGARGRSDHSMDPPGARRGIAGS